MVTVNSWARICFRNVYKFNRHVDRFDYGLLQSFLYIFSDITAQDSRLHRFRCARLDEVDIKEELSWRRSSIPTLHRQFIRKDSGEIIRIQLDHFRHSERCMLFWNELVYRPLHYSGVHSHWTISHFVWAHSCPHKQNQPQKKQERTTAHTHTNTIHTENDSHRKRKGHSHTHKITML